MAQESGERAEVELLRQIIRQLHRSPKHSADLPWMAGSPADDCYRRAFSKAAHNASQAAGQ